jgi:hypothetical protein
VQVAKKPVLGPRAQVRWPAACGENWWKCCKICRLHGVAESSLKARFHRPTHQHPHCRTRSSRPALSSPPSRRVRAIAASTAYHALEPLPASLVRLRLHTLPAEGPFTTASKSSSSACSSERPSLRTPSNDPVHPGPVNSSTEYPPDNYSSSLDESGQWPEPYAERRSARKQTRCVIC